MAMQEIGERVAIALGGAKAAIVTGHDGTIRIIWKDGLVQSNYRTKEMGCPAPIPGPLAAAKYLEGLAESGYFVTIRER